MDRVKTGGLAVFDDYGWEGEAIREPVDVFMQCMAGRYELVERATRSL